LVPYKWQPELRFLTIFREPISRDLSWYNHRLMEPGFPFCEDQVAGHFDKRDDVPHLGKGRGPTYAAEVECALSLLQQCMAVEAPAAEAMEAAEVSAFGLVKADEERGTLAGELYAQNRACITSELWGSYLAWGFYAAHLRRWTQFVSREQVLVFEFGHMLSDTPRHVQAALTFFGLPSSASNDFVLPHDNAHEGDAKLEMVECETKDQLHAAFAPWNEMLYISLAASAQKGERPSSEPDFPRFTAPPCTTNAQFPPNLRINASSLLASRRRRQRRQRRRLHLSQGAVLGAEPDAASLRLQPDSSSAI